MTQPTEETQSWDAFWAEVSRERTETIRGVEVRVPSDLPLEVMDRAEQLRDSSRVEDVAELVSMLFGQDVFAKWKVNGMGLVEFQTVLTWGLAHGTGNGLSFAEAYQRVREAAGGKPPAPQAGGAS